MYVLYNTLYYYIIGCILPLRDVIAVCRLEERADQYYYDSINAAHSVLPTSLPTVLITITLHSVW